MREWDPKKTSNWSTQLEWAGLFDPRLLVPPCFSSLCPAHANPKYPSSELMNEQINFSSPALPMNCLQTGLLVSTNHGITTTIIPMCQLWTEYFNRNLACPPPTHTPQVILREGANIFPILLVRKLKLFEVELTRGPTVGKWWSWDLNLGLSAPKSFFLIL